MLDLSTKLTADLAEADRIMAQEITAAMRKRFEAANLAYVEYNAAREFREAIWRGDGPVKLPNVVDGPGLATLISKGEE
jgi:hypothetical protein